MDLDLYKKFAKSISSDYLRRQAEKQEQKLADEFWDRIEKVLDEHDYATLLELMKDMKLAAEDHVDETELIGENRKLKDKIDQLNEQIHEMKEALLAK